MPYKCHILRLNVSIKILLILLSFVFVIWFLFLYSNFEFDICFYCCISSQSGWDYQCCWNLWG
jgi:hypothetical protein